MTIQPAKEKKDDENVDDEMLLKPPDGGWGWVIVFASFMVHVIADGIAYSFGVYVESFIEYFECTRSEIGLLGSLMLGVTWGTGPIASVLTNKFGCRIETILGTFIAAFGFIISVVIAEYVRNNVYLMYLTFGVIAGLGLGLAYLPAIVSVSYYFEKRRSLATGLAVCGSGIGTFLFAPLTEALVDEYGWKGTVLIETGLLFNCILCGAVMRPLEPKRRRRDQDSKRKSDQVELLSVVPTNEARVKSNGASNTSMKPSGSLMAIPSRLRTEGQPNISRSDGYVNHAGKKEPEHLKPLPPGPIDRKDVFYTKSIDNLPQYNRDPVAYKRSVLSLPPPDEEVDNECSLLAKIGCSKKMRHTCHEMMDFSLLLDLVFVLFGVSNLLTSIGFCVPYIYLPDRGIQMGFDTRLSAFLVSIVGISNTVGRIVFGYLADFKWVNRLMLYNTVLLLCGVTSIASSLCLNYPMMAVYAACFGLFIGVYTCLTPIVLVDLLGLDKLSNAFGLVLLFQGIGAVVGPPMAGALYDKYNNYDYSFYMMGVCVAVSGAMLYPIMCIRPQNRNTTDEEKKKGAGPKSSTAVVSVSIEEEDQRVGVNHV